MKWFRQSKSRRVLPLNEILPIPLAKPQSNSSLRETPFPCCSEVIWEVRFPFLQYCDSKSIWSFVLEYGNTKWLVPFANGLDGFSSCCEPLNFAFGFLVNFSYSLNWMLIKFAFEVFYFIVHFASGPYVCIGLIRDLSNCIHRWYDNASKLGYH